MGNSYGLKRKGVDLSQGPPKRKRDVVCTPAVIETPLVPAENAPSSLDYTAMSDFFLIL